MRIGIILLMLLISSYWSKGQGENNNWYFGDSAGVTFNSDNPVVLTNSAMFTTEGTSVASDEQGNLLFYTNGVTTWNRMHQIVSTPFFGQSKVDFSIIKSLLLLRSGNVGNQLHRL